MTREVLDVKFIRAGSFLTHPIFFRLVCIKLSLLFVLRTRISSHFLSEEAFIGLD